ncbi:MAG: hypothetical protein HYY24_11565 [Verrucomicrobia bacterium]|nr:hypothetical protein [Verrucomicrobiota bacterium]
MTVPHVAFSIASPTVLVDLIRRNRHAENWTGLRTLWFLRTATGSVAARGLPLFRRTALLAGLLGLAGAALGQTILHELDPNETAGERPYEMVWADRQEPAPPSLRFDQLAGWNLQVEAGAQATLQPSRAQNVWGRPVAKLRYRGEGKADTKPRVIHSPPQAAALPEDADSVDLWVHGNRWDWENPPDTPPVRMVLHLREGAGQTRELHVDNVRWKEWWLVHKRLPKGLKPPVVLESVEFAGGWQSQWREIFLDSIRFYREELPPLQFAPRPKRNLKLFEGQSAGANTGPGRLPFPTREETILPMHFGGKFRSEVVKVADEFVFRYRGEDCEIAYRFDATKGLSGVRAELSLLHASIDKLRSPSPQPSPAGRGSEAGGASNLRGVRDLPTTGSRLPLSPGERAGVRGKRASSHFSHESAGGPLVGSLLGGAAVRFANGPTNSTLSRCTLQRGIVTADYTDGTTLRLRLWQKSLVVDVLNRTGHATELSFGQLSGVTEPRTIFVPYLTYGGGAHPCVLLSRAGTNHVFTSIWLDWYRSNGSEPYAAESAATNTARINGGVRYHARTDGQRNPMFERLFITVSPMFEEVLPTVPNPVGLHANEAVDRLWQESWGPDNYEAQMKRSRMLRAYGIEKLIQCNHEIAWRDGGESFTLRTRAAPEKGGDEALQRYVAHQRGLGWFAGLYSNYTDYAPVNEFWSPDGVQRQSDGEWRRAWPRCYAEKPLKAVEFDALLAPQIKAKFKSNSAYTDVHTAVSPWGYNDYDARVSGAGTFAQTFYAYGEILRNDSRVYGGPIFSEGTYHWLSAGLADGNYALAYDGRPLAKEPLLPVFDLYQIHTKECDIGMGWTANFCDAIPDWRKPENLDRAIDRFLLHTLAYGHIGWLVEEDHGLARACRSYYMLQQVQARYGLKRPTRIAYWDGAKLVSVSQALVRDLPRTRRQLFVEYPGGLELWLNDHPNENWQVAISNSKFQISDLALPPEGWAAFTRDGKLVSYSALAGTNKVDYLRSPAYTYLDGRGQWFDAPEAASNGVLAIRPLDKNELEVLRISGDGAFTVRRPYKVRGACVTCDAFDVEGKRLASPVCHDSGGETRVEPVEKAVRYTLGFASRAR